MQSSPEQIYLKAQVSSRILRPISAPILPFVSVPFSTMIQVFQCGDKARACEKGPVVVAFELKYPMNHLTFPPTQKTGYYANHFQMTLQN